MSNEWLFDRLFEFVRQLDWCLKETTYANDRQVYAADIARVARWLLRLKEGGSPNVIALEIIQPDTAKAFTDYWRQGEMGARSAKAFAALVAEVKASGLIDESH